MTIWCREQGWRQASDHAHEILRAIQIELVEFAEPRPTLKSIRIGAGDTDDHDFEVEIELAPGVVVATRYQSIVEKGRDPQHLENERGAVARYVITTMKEFQAYDVGNLADILHDMRVRLRKRLAKWSSTGIYVRLLECRFVRTEYWDLENPLAVEFDLASLDDMLQPAVIQLEFSQLDEFEEELDASRAWFDYRFDNQHLLAQQGADGMIDKLAYNAIAQQGDVATALRSIVSGHSYEPSSGLIVFVENGHVQCRGRTSDGSFAWDRDTIVIYGQTIPETVAIALSGEPVTIFVAHSMLSDDMIIAGISSDLEDGVHSIKVKFEQPRLMFCGASGRVWRSDTVW